MIVEKKTIVEDTPNCKHAMDDDTQPEIVVQPVPEVTTWHPYKGKIIDTQA